VSEKDSYLGLRFVERLSSSASLLENDGEHLPNLQDSFLLDTSRQDFESSLARRKITALALYHIHYQPNTPIEYIIKKRIGHFYIKTTSLFLKSQPIVQINELICNHSRKDNNIPKALATKFLYEHNLPINLAPTEHYPVFFWSNDGSRKLRVEDQGFKFQIIGTPNAPGLAYLQDLINNRNYINNNYDYDSISLLPSFMKSN
jgi:hypothetical protein